MLRRVLFFCVACLLVCLCVARVPNTVLPNRFAVESISRSEMGSPGTGHTCNNAKLP